MLLNTCNFKIDHTIESGHLLGIADETDVFVDRLSLLTFCICSNVGKVIFGNVVVNGIAEKYKYLYKCNLFITYGTNHAFEIFV